MIFQLLKKKFKRFKKKEKKREEGAGLIKKYYSKKTITLNSGEDYGVRSEKIKETKFFVTKGSTFSGKKVFSLPLK